MAKYSNLIDYLNGEFYDNIFLSCSKYFNLHAEEFNLHSNYVTVPFKKNVTDIKVTSLYSENAENQYIIIKAIVMLEITIKGKTYGKKYSDVDCERVNEYVEVIIKTKFETKFEDFKVIKVNHIDDKSRYNAVGSSTKNLVPYMEESKLDIYAEKFLKELYPQALYKPTELPVIEIAKKLNLDIKYKKLDDDLFGQIYFLDDENYNIKAKTVFIDTEKSFINGIGNTKNTIIHECVHYYYHRRFFALQHLLDNSKSSIYCVNVESDSHNNEKYSEDLRWMEWQANSLAPRILMPLKTTKTKYEELYSYYSHLYHNDNVKLYLKILNEISKVFGVSNQLAKIRLIQLGYRQYIGINEYVDNDKYSYVTKKDSIKPGDTYRVAFNDFVFATIQSPKLMKAIEEERILYINGFLIINDKRYVEKKDKYYVIKKEALNAIDECCIKFNIKYKTNKVIDRLYSMCYLCRSNKHIPESIPRNISNDPKNDEIINESFENFIEYDEEDEKIISNLHCSFTKAFKYLYDYLNIPSFTYCAKECCLDTKTIISYYDGTVKEVKYKSVLAVCAGLSLRPRISIALLKTIRIDLASSPLIQDRVYYDLIHTRYASGLKEWNRLIKLSKIGDMHLLP